MVTDYQSDHADRAAWTLACAGIAAGLVLAVLFQGNPLLDIAFSSLIKQACNGDARHSGWCHENGMLWLPRWTAMMVAGGIFAGALFRVLLPRRAGRAQSRARWLMVVVAFVIGPGLIANAGLKDHWGRARPREVVELGGARQFTAPLVPSRECEENCSFVSGEAAGVFAAFFAAAIAVPQFRLALFTGGVALGLATGLVRMSTGGHFLSDVLFAGVFMAIAVAIAHATVSSLDARLRGLDWRRRGVPWPSWLSPAHSTRQITGGTQ